MVEQETGLQIGVPTTRGRRFSTYKKASGHLKGLMSFIGPAFVVSVAYIDPGNFATNLSGGSAYGYTLIWVILWSNLMAIFLQCLSAKLGIATGHNLPEMCGLVFKRSTNIFLWITAELAAMATEIAEFLGGALGFYLLFHIPMLWAGLLTAAATFFICCLEKYGQRVVEQIIVLLVAVISVSYGIELFLARPDWAQTGLHTLLPSLPDGQAVYIAAGMLGATVMPHVIFLHSQLVQCRNNGCTEKEKKRHLKMERIDIITAMNIAFAVNAAMVVVAAAVFRRSGISVDGIEQAQRSLEPLLGSLSSGAFGLALLASGLSSSAVGNMAGQTVMSGFVGIRLPENAMRVITMLPAVAVIIIGINPMKVLIFSQVVLSFELPLAIIPLLIITSRRSLMGAFVNRRITNIFGAAVAALIIGLNAVLVVLTAMGKT